MLNSKKDSLNSIFLNNVVDSIFDAFTTTAGTIYSISNSSYTVDPPNTYYYDYPKSYFWKFIEDYPCPTISAPSFPVSDFSLDENGSTLIEIAVSGFSEKEISIKRNDLKLIVEGNRKDKEDEVKRKYFYRNIAKRDFKLSFQGSDKWDFDKLEARMGEGILSIEIPLKEEYKPIKQEFKINS